MKKFKHIKINSPIFDIILHFTWESCIKLPFSRLHTKDSCPVYLTDISVPAKSSGVDWKLFVIYYWLSLQELTKEVKTFIKEIVQIILTPCNYYLHYISVFLPQKGLDSKTQVKIFSYKNKINFQFWRNIESINVKQTHKEQGYWIIPALINRRPKILC